MPPLTAAFAVLTVLSAAAPAAAQPPAFDGTWSVIFTCPASADGATGYTRRFLAGVQNGRLHGQTGVEGQASFLAFDGQIQPNGQALLVGQGMTGNPDYVVGRLRPATPYSFHVQASFGARNGTGHRVEVRPCEAVFSRQ